MVEDAEVGRKSHAVADAEAVSDDFVRTVGLEAHEFAAGSVLEVAAGIETPVGPRSDVIELHLGSHLGFVVEPLPIGIGSPQHDAFPRAECQTAILVDRRAANEDAVVNGLVDARCRIEFEVASASDVGPVENALLGIPNRAFTD